MKEKKKNSRINHLADTCPALFGVASLVIMLGALLFLDLSSNPVNMGLVRLGAAGVVALLLYPVFGLDYLKKPWKGWKAIPEMGKVLSVISILFLLIGGIVAAFAGSGIKTWLCDCIPYAFLFLAVGIFEEIVCRQALFMTLARQFRSHKYGTLTAAVIASLIFGMIHVVFELSFTPAGIITAIGKIVECAFTAMVLCGMLYKSKNLWVPILVHAFFDFSAFSTSIAVSGYAEIGSYVKTDMSTETLSVIAVYLVETLILLPAVIHVVKLFLAEEQTSRSLSKKYHSRQKIQATKHLLYETL